MAMTTSNKTCNNKEFTNLVKNLEQLRNEVKENKNKSEVDTLKVRLDRTATSLSVLTDNCQDQQREIATFKKQVTADLEKIIEGMRELARRIQ
jgi:predicted  nucleic acid-binding Zn-ribbon protein